MARQNIRLVSNPPEVALVPVAVPTEDIVLRERQVRDGDIALGFPPVSPAAVAAGGGGPVTGTGAIAIPALSLAGTGRETFTGTGAIAIPAPALSGTGKQSIAATGAVAFGAPTLAGTGRETFTGTGAIAIPPLALAGIGALSFTGTGAIAFGVPTLAATGEQRSLGSGMATARRRTIRRIYVPPAVRIAGHGFVGLPGPIPRGYGSVIVRENDEAVALLL